MARSSIRVSSHHIAQSPLSLSLPCSPAPHHAVSRIVASSSSDGAKVQLDVATNIYPLEAGQTLSFKLASSLDHSAAPNEGTAQEQQEQAKEAWRLDGPSLADEAGYVMYGKVSCAGREALGLQGWEESGGGRWAARAA